MRLGLLITILGAHLLLVTSPADASDFWHFKKPSLLWLHKNKHSEVYRPTVPCKYTMFNKHHAWHMKCFCKSRPSSSIFDQRNATCSRPIFHKSHFFNFWCHGESPLCRSPIFHEGGWWCKRFPGPGAH